MNREPDKYSVIKVKFDLIKIDDSKDILLMDAIRKCNQLYIFVTQFIRGFCIFMFYKKQSIPKINRDFVMMAFKCLTKKSNRGAPAKEDSSSIFNILNDYYEKTFVKLIRQENEDDRIDKLNLSGILINLAIDIVKNIENNIKMHYISHLNQFVNQMFKNENLDILNPLEKKSNLKKRKNLINNYI